VTGRKALLPSGTAFGVEGMEAEAGRGLIAELRAHITRPCFTTRYKVDAGDILLWDNYQCMHTAVPIEYSDDDGKRRLLYRISTRGIPALCAASQAA
jgi:taurine dioxygenase